MLTRLKFYLEKKDFINEKESGTVIDELKQRIIAVVGKLSRLKKKRSVSTGQIETDKTRFYDQINSEERSVEDEKHNAKER